MVSNSMGRLPEVGGNISRPGSNIGSDYEHMLESGVTFKKARKGQISEKPDRSILIKKGETLRKGKSIPKFTQSIFNYHTKLPSLTRAESHKHYHNFFKKENANIFSVPSLQKTPGMASIDPSYRYNALSKDKQCISALENKYRRSDPLSQKLVMNADLYRSLEMKKQLEGVSIVDVLNNNVNIDPEAEKEFIKTYIKLYNDSATMDGNNEKNLVGVEAIRDFYDHYKLLDIVVEQNKSKNLKSSIYTKLLTNTSSKKLLPMKLGILSLDKPSTSLNLQYYYINP